MATITSDIEEIIKELTRLQSLPSPYSDGSDDFDFPRSIYAGEGGSIVVSALIDKRIHEVADAMMEKDASLPARFTRAEWRAEIRKAFGPALAKIDLDDKPSDNANRVLPDIQSHAASLAQSSEPLEFAFGCTLLGNTDIKPFNLGPVRFEQRLAWLARKHGEGFISDVGRRRIEQAWTTKAKLTKRKASFDSLHETDILSCIGTCPFVCSVHTQGLGREAALERALVGARLAMTAISLVWQNPSRALEGMNLIFDRRIHQQRTLSFTPGKKRLAGARIQNLPHGPWMATGEWEKAAKRYAGIYKVVGEVLDYLISPNPVTRRPKMMSALGQSMLWFHEGCRENVSLMAIVKFSASMDALASGGKSSGIRKLITARLGLQDEKPISKGGPTLKAAIETIYGQGRSRTIHGTNDKLGHDWTDTRGLAETFARHCLVACLGWADKHPHSDDLEKLKS